MHPEIRIASSEADKELCFKLRQAVFVEELQIPADLEYDALDKNAIHFLGMIDEEAVCCGRVVCKGMDARVGRIATRQDCRAKGYGRVLMDAVEAWAGGKFHRLFLHAQKDVEGFYLKRGYVVCGDEFLEAGIVHVPMELRAVSERVHEGYCSVCKLWTTAPGPDAEKFSCSSCDAMLGRGGEAYV